MNEEESHNLSAAIEEVVQRYYEPLEEVARDLYFEAFTDGARKADSVRKRFELLLAKRSDVTASRIAYVSVGGANGAELAAALQHPTIAKGILLEYDQHLVHDFPNNVKGLSKEHATQISNLVKNESIHILTSDAWTRSLETNRILKNWFDDSAIDLALFSIQSVLHELPTRSLDPRYTHQAFLSRLFSGLPTVAMLCKEPCKVKDWSGMVDFDACTPELAKSFEKFAMFVADRFPEVFGRENSRTIHRQGATRLRIDGPLALEVAKKLTYALGDSPRPVVSKLRYEAGECHQLFDAEEFAVQCRGLFVPPEGYFSIRNGDSESFHNLWLRSGFQAYRAEDQVQLAAPQIFAEFAAIRSTPVDPPTISRPSDVSNKSARAQGKSPGKIVAQRTSSSLACRADERTRLAAVDTIFLHFVDHDIIDLFGLERIYPGGSLAHPFRQLAKLAVMLCSAHTSISAASCFETQYGSRLLRDLAPFVEARVLCAIGHAHNPLEYIERRMLKLATFPSRFPQYSSSPFSDASLLGRAWLGKPNSSTIALAKRWTAVANEQPTFWKDLYKAADQQFTRSTMRRIRDVPERLATRPFMVSDALDVLKISADVLSFRNGVNHLISSEWVSSLAAMTGTAFLVDTPYFHTDPVVPAAAPRVSVSRVNQLLTSVGLARVLYESSPSALLKLRWLPEWSIVRDDIVQRAAGRSFWAKADVEALRSIGRSLDPISGSELTAPVRRRLEQYLSLLHCTTMSSIH